MTRLALVTPEPILAMGLQACLKAAGGFQVTVWPGQLSELPAFDAPPHILLIDYTAHVTFASLAETINGRADSAVVLWAGEDIAPEFVLQAMDRGVRGILRNTLPAIQQLEGLRKIAAGEPYFEGSLVRRVMDLKMVNLSAREAQIAMLLSYGCRNREIADVLGISEGSTKVYISRLLHKCGIADRYELALYAMRNITPRHMETFEPKQPGRARTPSKPILPRILPRGLAIKPKPIEESRIVFKPRPAAPGKPPTPATLKLAADNARWERIYREKFEDPAYYNRAPIRGFGSTLNL